MGSLILRVIIVLVKVEWGFLVMVSFICGFISVGICSGCLMCLLGMECCCRFWWMFVCILVLIVCCGWWW